MIAHLHHCIEQLDLAAQQFAKNQAAYARFSLILTDNVAELMFHRFAEQQMKWDEMWRHIGKAKFAHRLGILTKPEERFILICHDYRNALYHQGLVHESVIADITWHYHDVVCSLMPRINGGGYWWSSRDFVSDVVKAYCGAKGLTVNPEKQIAEAAKQLATAKPKRERSLPVALSGAALERVEELDTDIQFLVSDSPDKKSRSDVVFHVQAWPFLFSSEAKGSIKLARGEKINNIDDALKMLRKYWKPPISSDPVSRWRSRSRLLAGEDCPLKAMDKYQNLMDQMNIFCGQVRDSAMALDQHIQQQIDLARGK